MTAQSGPPESGAKQRPGDRRAGIVLALTLVVLLVLAVAAAVLASTRSAPQLPAGSPEATVQEYLQLVRDHDLEAAARLLAPDGPCTVEDLDQGYIDQDTRVVLRQSRTSGDEASVLIEMVHGSGGLFGLDTWTSQDPFTLAREGDRWVITGEPWPMYSCTSPGRDGR